MEKYLYQKENLASNLTNVFITYEGRVAMCCYDWGATHPVGYVSKAFDNALFTRMY